MPSITRQRECRIENYGIFRTTASSILGESNLLVLAIYSPSIKQSTHQASRQKQCGCSIRSRILPQPFIDQRSDVIDDNPRFHSFPRIQKSHLFTGISTRTKMALVLFNATAESSTQNKAGTIIATDVCNSHELRQQTSEYILPQRPVNPFLVTNNTDANADADADADASASAPNRHMEILEAALDLTLASAPASENINESTYPRPPSHAIKIRRTRRSIRDYASSHENDKHSRSDADGRAQDEQLYDMATWRMCK